MKGKPKLRKHKRITWNNKHIARELSRSLAIPYAEARKLLQVIIKIMQDKLISDHYLQLPGLGRLKLSKLKKPNNRAAYRIITFQMYKNLDNYLNNVFRYRNFEYEIDQARKIRRLFLAGDKSRAKLLKKRLIERLKTRPECTEYMLVRNIWPLDI